MLVEITEGEQVKELERPKYWSSYLCRYSNVVEQTFASGKEEQANAPSLVPGTEVFLMTYCEWQRQNASVLPFDEEAETCSEKRMCRTIWQLKYKMGGDLVSTPGTKGHDE